MGTPSSVWEYVETERLQRKGFHDDRVEKLMIFSYGLPKVKKY